MFLQRAYVFLLVFVILVLCNGAAGITFQENRYELNVALSENALNVDPANYDQFLQDLKDVLTQASRILFEATDYRVFLGTVNILTPRFWAMSSASPTTKFSYASADVRVEETKEADDTTVIESLRTKNPKPCGQPGDHIVVPPNLFTNVGDWSDKYGDRAKTFIHEFARFRYGVFEEYGYESEISDNLFPYNFTNVYGHNQVTGCNNTIIDGRLRKVEDQTAECKLGEVSCRFYPEMNPQLGPSTSLMFMHYIKTTTKFCDRSNHDRTAPNRQNHFCRNRSVKTIIENSFDLRGKEPLEQSTNTAPTFNIQVAAEKVVYVVFDVATHGNREMEFNAAKEKVANDLINGLSTLNKRVLMGVAIMDANLTEVQAPIQVQGSELTLKNRVNSIKRAGTELNVEKGMLEVGHKLKTFAHLSGSVLLFLKFNERTDKSPNFETEALAFLNTLNARLVTYESNYASDGASLRYISLKSDGYHELSVNSDNPETSIDTIINAVLEEAQNPAHRVPIIPLVKRTVLVMPGNPIRDSIRNDYRPAGVEAFFFVPVSASGYAIKFRDVDITTDSPFTSWDGKYNIHVGSFNTTSTSTHSYEITSDALLSVHVYAAENLNPSDPLHLGGGGQVTNKPVEVELTTSGDNGALNMGLVTDEDASFLIYASIRKGVYAITYASVVALVQGPSDPEPVDLVDNGAYPDSLANDGIYSGVFKPSPINIPTTYTISAHIGHTISNPRSLPINQDSYCCGPSYTGEATSTFFQRYIPYAATLVVTGAAVYKEKPGRITDFRIVDNSRDIVTFQWTAPAASFGTQGKVDSYNIAYSDDSTKVIDPERGIVPPSANLINEMSLVSGTLQAVEPGLTQTVSVNLTQLENLSPLLYFTISSVKDGMSESYPAPTVYSGQTSSEFTTTTPSTPTPAATTTISTTTISTTSTTITRTTPTTNSPALETSTSNPVTPASTSTTTDRNGASRNYGSISVALTLYIFLQTLF